MRSVFFSFFFHSLIFQVPIEDVSQLFWGRPCGHQTHLACYARWHADRATSAGTPCPQLDGFPMTWDKRHVGVGGIVNAVGPGLAPPWGCRGGWYTVGAVTAGLAMGLPWTAAEMADETGISRDSRGAVLEWRDGRPGTAYHRGIYVYGRVSHACVFFWGQLCK